MSHFLQDLRYGCRTLARTPGFTLIAVLVLALGIGANTTVFSLANAFFLRPLPASDPGTIVRVYANRYSNVRYPTYVALRDRNSTLIGLAGFQAQPFGMRVDRETEHVFGNVVSGNYFPLLGLSPARGRLLSHADDRPEAAPAVVLSHALWTRRFGAAADVVGRTIALNDHAFTVVGIAPERFTGALAPLVADLWVPLASVALLRQSSEPYRQLEAMSLHLVGRLKPGVEQARAQADLDAIGHQVRTEAGQPIDRGQRTVSVYGSVMLHPEASTAVTAFTAVLMTLVALVLLIVCVNVANLVLARAAGRDVELAVRQSLGAGRARLIRQLLTENLLLSGAGAAGGLAIAYVTTRLAMTMPLPTPVPIALDLSLDGRVLMFTTLAAIIATLAFGAAPALTSSRIDLVRALKGLAGDGPRHGRLRSAFLVAQVSMSVVLLITAGLFIRSFQHAQSIDTGFDASRVMTASIDLETRGYSEARGRDFIRTLTERLESAPGVAAANLVDIVPLTLSNATTYMLRDGDVPPARGQQPPTPQIYLNAVGPGHFKTLGIAILEGRDFTTRDEDTAQGVAIVNETLARRFWPGQRAVGQRLRPAENVARAGTRTIEIIGVVRDSKYVTVGETERPFLYRPLTQSYTPRLTMLVRSSGAASSALPVLKEEVRKLDPGLAVFNIATLEEATAISLLPARIAGGLLAGLGILALGLAALGIFGVLSYLVRARTREMGIRVAIGARPETVAALVVRQALEWTVIGAAIGMALAFALTRFLAGFLYGISPTDPITFAAVALLLSIVAGVAALVPALRASRMDPLTALRTL